MEDFASASRSLLSPNPDSIGITDDRSALDGFPIRFHLAEASFSRPFQPDFPIVAATHRVLVNELFLNPAEAFLNQLS
ncbi:hypothetical protein GRI94_12720 [Erythrobacter jejuensis]|uniref:Uncharacterized protein n=1 Tax=Parerythrobacter jejuensis TaxID=795812 RepID=A0A845AUE8_9SPHN|nr:hypothetical protein [Parerythrobacter jejuensis]